MVELNGRDLINATVTNIVQVGSCAYTNAELADLLHALDVPFIWGDAQRAPDHPTDLTGIIVALACNEEARLRLALIPLFLRHPAFAPYAQNAAAQLSGDPLLMLRCYYTATYYLQQLYQARLSVLFGTRTPLPDLFSTELELPSIQMPETGLQALASRHRVLSGRMINWSGTYEHGAQRFLQYCEKRQGWQKSPLRVSGRS
ncbi:MAG: hypothetical protein R3C14_00360 [Caldilineaceae bacterium]